MNISNTEIHGMVLELLCAKKYIGAKQMANWSEHDGDKGEILKIIDILESGENKYDRI